MADRHGEGKTGASRPKEGRRESRRASRKVDWRKGEGERMWGVYLCMNVDAALDTHAEQARRCHSHEIR